MSKPLTWEAVYPVLCRWVDRGSVEERERLKQELLKLCKGADYLRTHKVNLMGEPQLRKDG